MYEDVDISKLPTRGVYYGDEAYIKIRPFESFEIVALGNMKRKSFMDQLAKLEFAMNSLDTNIDETEIRYSDAYHLFITSYGLTNSEIEISYGGQKYLCEIDSDKFIYTNPDFASKEDLYYKEKGMKFFSPSLHNMVKANINIINAYVENQDIINDKSMKERMALVPYLQRDKLSDDALGFVNEHMQQFSDQDILDMRSFLNEKENIIIGQSFKINYMGKEKKLSVDICKLI